jgi:hypothetical protein
MLLPSDNSPLLTPPLAGVRRRKRGPAPRPAKDIQAQDLQGFKRLQRVAELLAHLHLVGCDRDKAHNRELHFDDYVLLMLLAMFNPILDSLRTLQMVSDLEEVRERLGIKKRINLGSFSESCRVFEPELLDEVIAQLWTQLPAHQRPEMFKDLPGKIKLVDGTVIRTLRTVAGAMWLKSKAGWRLHMQFDVDTYVPSSLDITDPRNSGKSDEKNILRKHLQAACTYVMDRWFAQFRLFNDIHDAGSHYVCRLRDNSVYTVVEDRPLTEADKAAGILSDQVVLLGQDRSGADRPNHPIRLIRVTCTPHEKRANSKTKTLTHGGTAGPPSDGVLRIATDMLDVPAEIISFLFAYRWTIEVFIRFFKQVLGNRHLMSTKPEGIRIQIAAGIMCCMLMLILTGVKPTKQLHLLMSLYLSGWAKPAEVSREIEKERVRQLRASQKKN